MFEEFVNRKLEEYSKQVEFTGNTVSFQKIRQSGLPPFIINFLESRGLGTGGKKPLLTQGEFEKNLQEAIVFNVNYVIKPKATLLKFLFGNTDARPADYIIQRLAYFQFYRYYIDAIIEFIQLRQPPIISATQIEEMLNKINKKILAEINDADSSDTQRLNLIKLLYHFFIDLTQNNPINIKLPKNILTAFFQDKQFYEIKKRTENFFKEDIFIQEAVELMKRKEDKEEKPPEEPIEVQEPDLEKTLNKLRSSFLDNEVTTREISKTQASETEGISVPADSGLNPAGTDMPQEQIYSPELLEVTADQPEPEPLTPEERKKKIQDELFCEINYRKKILKKIFRKDEKQFSEFVSKLLDIRSWETASDFINDYFAKNDVDYYSEEAVKFVDIMEDYFNRTDEEQNAGNTL